MKKIFGVFSNNSNFDCDLLRIIKSIKVKNNIQLNFLNSGSLKKNFQKL